MRQGFNMFKNILLTFLLQMLLASNICNAEEILRFKENEDIHIMKLNQKGLYPHNYIHAGANGNPFVFNYEVITNDYAVLTLTDLQGKTNEIIDISSSSFEITEYYLEDNPQIKFWVVCGDRLPKYRNDFGSVDVEYVESKARNVYDILIITPTKEGGYKIIFRRGPEDLDEAKRVPSFGESLEETKKIPGQKELKPMPSIQRRVLVNRKNELTIYRAWFDFDTKKWDSYAVVYGFRWDKEEHEVKIERKGAIKEKIDITY